jgi:hypothetical protein
VPKTRDYFAELYVAGVLADAGWNVYFPHRDRGMDFIASITNDAGQEIIRPVQVKGKYPTGQKTDKVTYGYVGRLNQIHPEMVLAIPYFKTAALGPPLFTAFMPFSQVRPHSRGYRCEPASFKAGAPKPRRDFRRFVDEAGLRLMRGTEWPSL